MPMKNLQGPQMKISELRALLDRTSSENIKRMLVEVYRALPKKTRENLAIDELLKNPAATRAGAKQSKALAHSVDIDDLQPELEEFLSDAYARNYFAPNRFVPKSERPKWRFKAKRFFKEINAAVVEPGSIEKASDLIAPVLGRDASSRLIETVFAIETVTDIRNLRRLLQHA